MPGAWDPEKHPRAEGGRWGETPDAEKVTRDSRERETETLAKLKARGDSQNPDRPMAKDKEGKHEVPAARKWVEKIDTLPDETWKKHFDKNPAEHRDAKPSPERQKLHDKISEDIVSKTSPVPKDQKPVAILMMGGPASGKSSMLEGVDKTKFVKVDADAIKERLPEYREALNLDNQRGKDAPTARNAASMAHEESSFLAKRVRDTAIEQNKNLIFDGTGANAKTYSHMVDRLKSKGYHVTVMGVDLENVEHAKEFVAIRAEKRGRFVPDSEVERIYSKIPSSFEIVARKADQATLYRRLKGQPTAEVWSHVGGKETTKDVEYYRRFRKRGGAE